MSLKKLAICAAALIAATVGSHLAQAGGKGATGVGHITVPSGSGDKGKSANAPGDVMHDKGIPAKESAPGDVKNDLKSTKK